MSDIPSIQRRTHALLEQIFDPPVDPPNEAGDWYFSYGSAGLIVSILQREDEEFPVVLVASPILSDTQKTPQLLDALNDMNSGLHFGRAYWSNGYVWVAANMIAETLDREELAHALNVIGHWSDTVDEAFAQGFGGVLPFAPQQPPSGAWAPQQAAVGGSPPPGMT
jgi:hypothetical protein